MKKWIFTFVFFGWVVISFADDLEARVDVLEQKMDRIIELLEKTSAEGKEGQAVGEVETKSKDGDELKPQVAEKTLLKNGTSLQAYLVTESSWQTSQQGDAIVAVTDKGAKFTIANFLATPATKTFENHQVGVKWAGVFMDRYSG